MAITNRYYFKTVVQTSDHDVFEVLIRMSDGVGVVRKLRAVAANTKPPKGTFNPKSYALTETAITVDGGSLSAWQVMSANERVHAVVYNTAKSLQTVCAAI